MAADVSCLARILSGYKEDRTVGIESGGAKSTALFTRDLLGGCDGVGSVKIDQSQELDLDLQVPSGWEKRLDLKSGKVYLQRCNNSTTSPSSSPPRRPPPPLLQDQFKFNHTYQTVPPSKLQDLNFPPSSSSSPIKPLLNLFDDTCLDLKLSAAAAGAAPGGANSFQSVCTLDKVKWALERAERDPTPRKRSSSSYSSPQSSSSAATARDEEIVSRDKTVMTSSSPVAAGCPGCLSYVLVMKENPKCPRCNSFVPVPAMKKPRIDLNISI